MRIDAGDGGWDDVGEGVADRAPPCVLIVDDDEVSRETIATALARENVQLAFAASGAEALSTVAAGRVDLVLLDVMMPGMDGFEVCRRLKSDPALAPIPVILVTALDSPKDLLRGLDAGAEEFVSKPVHRTELRARVRSMLRVKRNYEQMRELSERMLRLHRQRDVLTSFLVHDFKNPLAVIAMNAAVCLKRELPPPIRQSLADVAGAASLLERMVLDLIDIARNEEGRLALRTQPSLDLGEVARDVAAGERERADEQRIDVRIEAADAPPIEADPDLVRRVIANLLDNALKYAPPRSEVRVAIERLDAGVALSVSDCGPGIPEHVRAHVFDRFVRDEHGPEMHDRRSRGLGLAFCKAAIEAHGGRIGVEPVDPTGVRIRFELPLVPAR